MQDCRADGTLLNLLNDRILANTWKTTLSRACWQFLSRPATRLGTMIAKHSVALVRWPDAKTEIACGEPSKAGVNTRRSKELKTERKSFLETSIDINLFEEPWRHCRKVFVKLAAAGGESLAKQAVESRTGADASASVPSGRDPDGLARRFDRHDF
jgi:hypothetical protein